MTLMTISLSLADRHLINELIAGLKKSDTTTARTVKTIRDRLAIRPVKKFVETLIEEAREMKRNLDWDELIEYDGEEFAAKEFTLDDSYVNWILEELKVRNWNETRMPDGKTELLPVPPGLLEAIANLADALSTARAVADKGV